MEKKIQTAHPINIDYYDRQIMEQNNFTIEQLAQWKIDQQKALDECHEQLADAAKEVTRRNNRLMKAIRSALGRSFHYSISKYLKDLKEECYNSEFMQYELVRKISGRQQYKEKWGKNELDIYVNQWSVGMEGDSFEGYVYIKIDSKRFLKVNYSM